VSNGEHIHLEELELFALGALPDEEAATVQAHVADCAECTKRLAEAHGAAAMVAFAAPQDRPAGTIKAELMARVRANRRSEEMNAWPPRRAQEREGEIKGWPNPRGRKYWWTWVLVPTAVALALVSIGLSWQNRRIAAELQRERQAAESLIHERQEIEKLVGVLAAPDTVTVKLAAVEGTANESGVVKFNSKAGVVLYEAKLPALPADKSYQMWLVPENGTPISAGLLGPGGHPWGNMWTAEVPANTQAKAFAITIEPVGGMAQPTGPKVLLGAT
jgi:anti-sigma-K factor RskA